MACDVSFIKAGYKSDKWKWALNLSDKQSLLLNSNLINEKISKANLIQVYGLNKQPKALPCRKKCSLNPWCLVSLLRENKSKALALTEQLRDMKHPIGLQNTANTCWINSAIQALFHLQCFRNCINSIEGFEGEESFTSLEYLLQAMFVEMELHKNKALECSSGSVFEKLAIFVSKEIMQKDQDFEVLKCVSEFLENTIDSLLGNPKTGPRFSSIFRTTLHRFAKWKCTSCGKEHVWQLPPDTCYTMAAYVSADECPLNQCILDLQTETQTGVSLVCGDGGCGETVKVDRVVTPKILSLPSLLIIRNNSLIDREIKRRLHVVYPEVLDLSSQTCNNEPAPYSLRSVIYHHGHWIKHFSAHVKTEDGKWFNFNDEKVSSLVSRPGNCIPLETHKDYFSVANVASKYKNRPKVRVSRGAFIWIYERDSGVKENSYLQPPNTVIDYVLAKQRSKQTTDIHLIELMKTKRNKLYEKLAVEDSKQDVCLISRPLLSAWYCCQDLKFVPQPSLLREGICEHLKVDPMKANLFKCIKKSEAENLLKDECGIHCDEKVPLIFSIDDSFCKQCVSKHVHHILFRDNLKELYKKVKKLSSKEFQTGTTFIGLTTLANWTKLALNVYMKETGLDEIENTTEEDSENGVKNSPDGEVPDQEEKNSLDGDKKSVECNEEGKEGNASTKENGITAKSEDDESFTHFNEDVVCVHNMRDPKALGVWVPHDVVAEMRKQCVGMIHPASEAKDFGTCHTCKEDMDKTLETCNAGKQERKQLYHLFVERKRPHPEKDAQCPLYLLSRSFFNEWKSFLRMCVKDDPQICKPSKIVNSDLVCKHQQLLYPCDMNGALDDFALLIWESEWNTLIASYSFDHSIRVQYEEGGTLVPEIGLCTEGCVEKEAAKLYEDQFDFEYELIHIRQVNSAADVPSGLCETEDGNPSPKKARMTTAKNDVVGLSLRTVTQRLVRASKTFSSSDTIKEIQNFIAERTGIWPLLQTLWLKGGKEHGTDPLFLTDKHRSMTLKALRVKPGDTIYFRAALEDMEKAAGDGETEYNEIESED